MATGGLLAIAAPPCTADPIASAPTLHQSQTTSSIVMGKQHFQVQGRLSLGLLNGESNELVYNTDGSKLSELNWQLENTAMLGIGGSITPCRWFTLNADVWFNLTDDSEMDDHDWYVTGMPWTDWSHHSDTSVDTATLLDINATIPVLQRNTTRVFGILGYMRNKFEWSARGGSYIYSVYGFRDFSATLPDDIEVISYEQTFSTPYIGIGFTAQLHPVTLTGRVIGSTLVNVDSLDHHHLRNLVFEDDLETGSMVGLDLAAAYDFTSRLHFSAGFHYQRYEEVKGSVSVTDTTTGQVTVYGGDTDGADNSFNMFSIGIRYDL